jgi:signal transduction histidine kinase
MRKYVLSFVLILLCISAGIASIDTLKRYFEALPLPEQLRAIEKIPFQEVTENSRQIIPFLKKYEPIAREQKEYRCLAFIYLQLSLAYYYQGKYDENLKYGLMSTHLLDSLGDKSQLGTMYGELGYQMKYRDLKRAFGLMRKGIAVLEELGNPEPLSKIYNNYGVLYEINGQVDSAIHFYRKSLGIKQKLNDIFGIPFSLNNLYMAYMLINRYDSAYKYLDQSTAMRLKSNDALGLAENYGYYSQFYSVQGNFHKAIEFCRKTLEITERLGYKNLSMNTYKSLSEYFEKLNDYPNALKYHKLFTAYQDSLINLETNKAIADLQIQYETAEKEKELLVKSQQLEKERMTKTFIVIVSSVLVAFIVVFSRNKLLIARRNAKIGAQLALIEGEQAERNRVALELHDGIANEINSAIITLNGYIEKTASHADEGISILRTKLTESHQNVRKLSHALMPRSLETQGLKAALEILGADFSTPQLQIEVQTIGLEDRVDRFIEFNVYRITQEALNNIIKHARASKVLIDCSKVDNMLLLSIEDNGVGFNPNETVEPKGVGLKNITNRVKLMNGIVNFTSRLNEGTTIEIQIPLK